ncbi:MAG TPA: orotidine-5'-phosphate decarboxylase, partial [Chthoniobacterales bacterium]
MLQPRDCLIVALDFPTQAKALALVAALADSVSTYKIGLQLYTAAGPAVVQAVAATGAKIFLDLKLHDIPNTVAKAVAAAGELGVAMLTLHLSGGAAMVKAAVETKPPHLSLLGVTVLTSATQETLGEIGVQAELTEHVTHLGEMGSRSGIDGLITSPQEVALLRQRLGPQIMLVTPGVRPAWAAADDQKRFTTPRQAVDRGADYLVIGRPITAAADPRAAVERVVEELSRSGVSMLGALHVYDDLEPKPAALNMAVDEALVAAASVPVLRFYRWRRPSISFGYFGRYAEAASEARERE